MLLTSTIGRRKPTKKEKRGRQLLPNIEGLPPTALKTEFCILGVVVNDRLRWHAHVEQVGASQLQNHRRVLTGEMAGRNRFGTRS
jgi:hypothetical protein